MLHTGPIRHTIIQGRAPSEQDDQVRLDLATGEERYPRPTPIVRVHETTFCYSGDIAPSEPGGLAAVYRELIADQGRLDQVVSGRDSTAQPWTRCSSPHRLRPKGGWSNVRVESYVVIRVRRLPKFTTTTTRSPGSLRHPWRNAPPATSALASLIPDSVARLAVKRRDVTALMLVSKGGIL